MFQDLLMRAENYGNDFKIQKVKTEENVELIRKTIEDAITEIKTLGFEKVSYQKLFKDSFSIHIYTRKDYNSVASSFNMKLHVENNVPILEYGYSYPCKNSIIFNNMTDLQIMQHTKNTLRKLVGDALKDLEINKIKGFA